MFRIIFKKKVFHIIFFFITLPLISYAQEGYKELEEVSIFKNGINEMAASTHSINAQFTQSKYMSILSNELSSDGVLKFKKPNLLRWEYKNPYSYTVILNGQKLLISDEGKVNSFDITSSKAFQQINELIINSVQGNVLDEKRFVISYFEGKDLYLVKLSPKEKQMKDFLEEIHVFFDKSDYSVSKLKMLEPGGDYTIISFNKKILNEAIPDKAFKLE